LHQGFGVVAAYDVELAVEGGNPGVMMPCGQIRTAAPGIGLEAIDQQSGLVAETACQIDSIADRGGVELGVGHRHGTKLDPGAEVGSRRRARQWPTGSEEGEKADHCDMWATQSSSVHCSASFSR